MAEAAVGAAGRPLRAQRVQVHRDGPHPLRPPLLRPRHLTRLPAPAGRTSDWVAIVKTASPLRTLFSFAVHPVRDSLYHEKIIPA